MDSPESATTEFIENLRKLLNKDLPKENLWFTLTALHSTETRKSTEVETEEYYKKLLNYFNKSSASRLKVTEINYIEFIEHPIYMCIELEPILLFLERIMIAKFEVTLGHSKSLELRTLILTFCNYYLNILKNTNNLSHYLIHDKNVDHETIILDKIKYHLYLYILASIRMPSIVQLTEEDSFIQPTLFYTMCIHDLMGNIFCRLQPENYYLTIQMLNLTLPLGTSKEFCPFL